MSAYNRSRPVTGPMAGQRGNYGGFHRHTLRRGAGSRGAEKPWGFFSLGGAPIPGVGAEKPGGFFSGGKSQPFAESRVGGFARHSLNYVKQFPDYHDIGFGQSSHERSPRY